MRRLDARSALRRSNPRIRLDKAATGALLFMLAIGPMASASPAAPADAEFDLVVTDVHVVDVETGSIAEDRTVVIDDGLIHAVLASDAPAPSAAATLEGRGRYLIPGLIDMHVHMNRDSLPLFLRFGVTTVRDMGTHFAPLEPDSGGQLAIRDEIEAGTLDGPELVLALRILDGPNPRNPQWAMHYASIATPEEGRALVDQVADAGGDFIKVYTDLSAESFAAIVDRAKERDLAVVGHVPGEVGYLAAAEAGLRTAEHLRGIFMDLSSEEDRWRAGFAAAVETGDPSASYRYTHARLTEMAATRDAAKEAALFDALRTHDVGIVPTLVVLDDPRWRYPSAMPDPALVDELSTIYRRIVTPSGDPKGPFESVADALAAFQLRRDLVGRLHAAGVPILVGTDASNPFVVPGISMHTELGHLVRSGLTAAEALRAATLVNARFLDADDRIGSIAAGKEADLVLLEANPLEDIAATRAIAEIIVNGRIHAPEADTDG